MYRRFSLLFIFPFSSYNIFNDVFGHRHVVYDCGQFIIIILPLFVPVKPGGPLNHPFLPVRLKQAIRW